MAALGIERLHMLGYRDSGMAGTPANANPLAFTNVDFEAAVARLIAVVRAERPQVIVTYDEQGGYGHPDHIMAHRIAVQFQAAFRKGLHQVDAAARGIHLGSRDHVRRA